MFNSIFQNYAFNVFFRLRKIRDGQHSEREETLNGDYETQLTAVSFASANGRSGVCSFQANGSNRDDSYVETSEVITDYFNKLQAIVKCLMKLLPTKMMVMSYLMK